MEVVAAPGLRSREAESLAVRAGGLVFTGGLTAEALGAPLPRASFEAEAEAIGEAAREVPALCGSGFSAVAKVKATLGDMAHAPACRALLERIVGPQPPLSLIGSHPMHPDTVLSVEIVAGAGLRPRHLQPRGGVRVAALGSLLFSAGSAPRDEAGGILAPGDLGRQARAALEGIVAVFGEAGAAVDDIVKVNNTASCWHQYGLYNAVYDELFRGSQAARCSVGGILEDPLALIEVEAVASLDRHRTFVDSTRSGVGRTGFSPDPRTRYLREIGPCKGPHTHGARAGDVVFIAGECPYDAEDRLVGPGDVEAQTVQTMRNVEMSLEALGVGLADVVKTNVTLADARLVSGFERAYRRFFREPFPARSVTATPLGQYGILVEIEAIAVAGAARDGIAILGAVQP